MAGRKCFVMIRFGLAGVQECRNTFNKYFSVLGNYTGKFLGMSDDVEVIEGQKGLWPGHQGVVLLQFDDMEEAQRWYNSMPEVRQQDWLHGVDIVFIPARSSFHGTINAAQGTIVLLDCQLHDKQGFFDQYATPAGQEIRRHCAVAAMTATERVKKQRGHWDPNYVILHHFQSKDHVRQLYNSDAYNALKPVRYSSATTDMVVFDLDSLDVQSRRG